MFHVGSSHRRGFSHHAAAHLVPEVTHADAPSVQRPAVALCCRPADRGRNCSLRVVLGHPDRKCTGSSTQGAQRNPTSGWRRSSEGLQEGRVQTRREQSVKLKSLDPQKHKKCFNSHKKSTNGWKEKKNPVGASASICGDRKQTNVLLSLNELNKNIIWWFYLIHLIFFLVWSLFQLTDD